PFIRCNDTIKTSRVTYPWTLCFLQTQWRDHLEGRIQLLLCSLRPRSRISHAIGAANIVMVAEVFHRVHRRGERLEPPGQARGPAIDYIFEVTVESLFREIF